ncbi:hypothetical protein EVAR_90072_1 [Eumeta japonica]|uniref:Uncharacterized protein n=1 Tax=Eumeta variegata TaxID=151549 RepID=A0A4C1TCR3_EUMVA|nr:hypothetical protein EVAR_90072_1 [Eumeta japonica]
MPDDAFRVVRRACHAPSALTRAVRPRSVSSRRAVARPSLDAIRHSRLPTSLSGECFSGFPVHSTHAYGREVCRIDIFPTPPRRKWATKTYGAPPP